MQQVQVGALWVEALNTSALLYATHTYTHFPWGCLQIAIAFPDEGAWKRFHKALQHYPTVCASGLLLLLCYPTVLCSN